MTSGVSVTILDQDIGDRASFKTWVELHCHSVNSPTCGDTPPRIAVVDVGRPVRGRSWTTMADPSMSAEASKATLFSSCRGSDSFGASCFVLTMSPTE